jgi:hypothetical protein
MTECYAAIVLFALGAVLLLDIYFLMRYVIAADSLRKLLNRSSGDGKRSRYGCPPPS